MKRGKDKVQRAAAEQYKLFYQSEDFDPQQFFINQNIITMARRKTVTPRTKVCTVTGLETSFR
jgi:hypothetical protein